MGGKVHCGSGYRHVKGFGCVTDYKPEAKAIGGGSSQNTGFKATTKALLALGPLRPVAGHVPSAVKPTTYRIPKKKR